MSFLTVTPISGQSVDAGTANDPVAVRIDDPLNEIIVYVNNDGDSTNLVINIGSSPDGEMSSTIQSLTLNTTVRTGHVPIKVVPRYLIFTATNNDSVNNTTYTVKISERA